MVKGKTRPPSPVPSSKEGEGGSFCSASLATPGARTRILGIDPGLRVTGFGVLDKTGQRLSYVTSGCIRTRDGELAARLKIILDGLAEVIAGCRSSRRWSATATRKRSRCRKWSGGCSSSTAIPVPTRPTLSPAPSATPTAGRAWAGWQPQVTAFAGGGWFDRKNQRYACRQAPAAGPGGCRRRRLRDSRADEHALSVAGHRRQCRAAHPFHRARGCA